MQLPLPFPIAQPDLAAFLGAYTVLEDEIDRLKAELAVCKEQYQDALPMRAVLTALKVTRARRKLAAHAKEPLSLPHQAYLEELVDAHLDAQELAVERFVAGAQQLGADGVAVTFEVAP